MGDTPDTSLDEFDLDSHDTPSNENFVSLRKYARKMEKDLKAERAAHGETRTAFEALQTETRTGSVKQTAKAKGLSDAQIDAILAISPGATAEQVEALAKVFPVAAAPAEGEGESGEETEGATPPEGGGAPPAGFTPSSGGSKVPPKPYTSDDVSAALAKGDRQSLERMAVEAAKDPSKLNLKYAHLIEDD